MTLEHLSQLAGIGSFILSIFTLFGVVSVNKKINQKNDNNITVNGDAVFKGSFNVSSKEETPRYE